MAASYNPLVMRTVSVHAFFFTRGAVVLPDDFPDPGAAR